VAAGSTVNDLALNRYLELIATTRKSVLNAEGNDVELEEPNLKIKSEEITSKSGLNQINLNNSKKSESDSITSTDDAVGVGVGVGGTETIAIQINSTEPSSLIDEQKYDSSCSDNGSIENDKKKGNNTTPNKKKKRNTKKNIMFK